MLITLDIKNESKRESFLNFLSAFDYVEIKSHKKENIKIKSEICKNKFNEFAGLWENRDINLKSIREKAWK